MKSSLYFSANIFFAIFFITFGLVYNLERQESKRKYINALFARDRVKEYKENEKDIYLYSKSGITSSEKKLEQNKISMDEDYIGEVKQNKYSFIPKIKSEKIANPSTKGKNKTTSAPKNFSFVSAKSPNQFNSQNSSLVSSSQTSSLASSFKKSKQENPQINYDYFEDYSLDETEEVLSISSESNLPNQKNLSNNFVQATINSSYTFQAGSQSPVIIYLLETAGKFNAGTKLTGFGYINANKRISVKITNAIIDNYLEEINAIVYSKDKLEGLYCDIDEKEATNIFKEIGNTTTDFLTNKVSGDANLIANPVNDGLELQASEITAKIKKQKIYIRFIEK